MCATRRRRRFSRSSPQALRISAIACDWQATTSNNSPLPPGAGGLSPGDRVMVTLYLRKLADAGIAYDVLLRLVGPDGVEIWRDEGWVGGGCDTSRLA